MVMTGEKPISMGLVSSNPDGKDLHPNPLYG
jgi:hypothetical protein